MRKDGGGGGEAGGVGGRGSGERGVSEASNKPKPNKRALERNSSKFSDSTTLAAVNGTVPRGISWACALAAHAPPLPGPLRNMRARRD